MSIGQEAGVRTSGDALKAEQEVAVERVRPVRRRHTLGVCHALSAAICGVQRLARRIQQRRDVRPICPDEATALIMKQPRSEKPPSIGGGDKVFAIC